MASEEERMATENLDYLRRLYSNVLDWNRTSAGMAQLLLTLDGLIITFSSSGLVQDILNVRDETSFDPSLLSLAVAVLLSFSVYCAVEALHGKLSDADLREVHNSFGVVPGKLDSYDPRTAWWFGMIAAVSGSEAKTHHEAWRDSLAGSLIGRALFWRGKRKAGDPDIPPPDPLLDGMEAYLLKMTADEERKALASEIVTLSNHTLQNYRWVNRGWALSGLSLIVVVLGSWVVVS